MAFSTRPILSNEYFQQPSGETLTMSGDTNFTGTLKSKGVEINLDTTSASTGYVMTLDTDGKVKLNVLPLPFVNVINWPEILAVVNPKLAEVNKDDVAEFKFVIDVLTDAEFASNELTLWSFDCV